MFFCDLYRFDVPAPVGSPDDKLIAVLLGAAQWSILHSIVLYIDEMFDFFQYLGIFDRWEVQSLAYFCYVLKEIHVYYLSLSDGQHSLEQKTEKFAGLFESLTLEQLQYVVDFLGCDELYAFAEQKGGAVNYAYITCRGAAEGILTEKKAALHPSITP